MTSQIISYIIGTAIGIIVVLLIDIFWWSIRIRERAHGHMAELDAEEQKREAERRDIPKPERPEDATVGEVKSRLYCSDGCIIKKEGFALFCKGKIVQIYPTRTEAEAAWLQFIRDYDIKGKEENYEL